MKGLVTVLAITLNLILPGFSTAGPPEKIPVYVSVPPQQFFVKAVGGDQVEVFVMVNPAKSPADYEPSPEQMKSLAKAKIYFAVGVPFEDAWLEKFSGVNPGMRIIHTEDGIEKKPIRRNHPFYSPSPKERTSDDSESSGEIMDPHIWLSPPLVLTQAKHILSALCDAAPDQKIMFENNYNNFITQVTKLDAALRTRFAGDAGKRFLVFHPSWGYFAEAYGLKQVPIEYEGKSPKAQEVQRLIRYAGKYGLTDILVQPQFDTRYAEIIAQPIGGRLLYADPLAANWAENLESTASLIKQALR